LVSILLVAFLGLSIYSCRINNDAKVKFPPSNYIDIEWLKLHYEEKGVGQPVIFIGGRNGRIQDFTLSPLYDLVTRDYHVIFIDRPGLGYSDSIRDGNSTVSNQTRLIHSAIQKMNISKPIIIGQSLGGVTALQYALDFPDDVLGVILLGTAPYPKETQPDPLFDSIEGIARIPLLGDLFLVFYSPIARLAAPAYLELEKDYFAPLTKVPETYQKTTIFISLQTKNIKADAIEQQFVMQDLDSVSKRLNEISIPVCDVVGEYDYEAVKQSKRLDTDIPKAEVIIVKNANHFFWYANPQVVIEALERTTEIVHY
jgi:pimeloyl-ACP methyl ester carboxylesterase